MDKIDLLADIAQYSSPYICKLNNIYQAKTKECYGWFEVEFWTRS